MKKILSLSFVCFVVLALIATVAKAETFRGYFITNKDQTQAVDEFMDLNDYFRFKYKANETKISFSEIKSIIFLENNWAIIIKKNGKKFKVRSSARELSGRYLKYRYFDLVTEKAVETSIFQGYIKEIGFAKDFGDLRECPICGRSFFPDYIFCPFDKAKLNLIIVK